MRADVAAHRRWGKDEVAMHWTAQRMATYPGVYWHLLPEASQGRRAVWEAVNPHTGKKRIDEAFRRRLCKTVRNDEMTIEHLNGSVWQVLGSDNYNSLVGAPPRSVVLSEWALARPEAWAYLRPMLAENGRWALFLSADDANRRPSASFENARGKAPIDLLTAQLGLFGDLPLELFRGETSTGNSQTTGKTRTSGFNFGVEGPLQGRG